MNKISLFLKGFIIGLGKIIPGVSGAMFAIIFGVYEDMLECISSLQGFLKNYKRLFFLVIGIVLAIIFGSGVIRFLLNTCYSESVAFFIGIMSFGLIPLLKEVRMLSIQKKDIIIALGIVTILVVVFSFNFSSKATLLTGSFKDFISLFLCGILDAISTIIPGISGTSLLMLVGFYEVIIDAFANVLSNGFFNSIKILFPFLLGLGFGVIFLAKLLKYLFFKYKSIMKLSILGFVIFSLFILSKGVIINLFAYEILSVIIFFVLGFLLGYFIENKIK